MKTNKKNKKIWYFIKKDKKLFRKDKKNTICNIYLQVILNKLKNLLNIKELSDKKNKKINYGFMLLNL